MDNSNKRSYFLGLLTGCIIAAFILCLVLIVKVITGGDGAASGSRGNIKPTEKPTQTAGAPDESGNEPSPAAVADDGLVLDDPRVSTKMEYLEKLIEVLPEIKAVMKGKTFSYDFGKSFFAYCCDSDKFAYHKFLFYHE